MNIAVIIVTRNRKEKLLECIEANSKQSFVPHGIIIVDNASTDGTQELVNKINQVIPKIFYLRFSQNLGSAGGFAEGLKFALSNDFDWYWLMDDDCIPKEDALEQILRYASKNTNAIYGSYPIDRKTQESFWVRLKNNDLSFSSSLPFNGFLIHRDVVKKISLPEKKLFFRNDDTEYSFRARFYGFHLFVVNKSIIYHPVPKVRRIRILKTLVQFYESDSLFNSFYAARNFVAVYFAYLPFLGIFQLFYRMTRYLLNILYELLCSKNRWQKLKNYTKAINEGIKLSYEVSKNFKRK